LHDAVCRLRHRLLAAGLEPAEIETVHGVGYRLVGSI
jgi:DNA-binding response OmpR family regulator